MARKKTDQLAFDLDESIESAKKLLTKIDPPAELATVRRDMREPDAEPEIFSVGQIVRQLRQVVEARFGTVWVRGEISNLRKQASGHQYFTLKDEASRLSCVLFAGVARQNRSVAVVDGAEVILCGELGVYEPQGQFQMVVRIVQATGVGALQAKFEALKTKLAAEGLFDSSRKSLLPAFPTRIAVVTSPSGAAIRDFLNVLHRRMPSIEVFIFPVRVQGRGAANEIAAAIEILGSRKSHGLPGIDAIVVTRGGGSIEDLWEFNEEIVARAVAACPVPIVSAVGHEIDFTICDFAADLRAPTPSAAAELLAPDRDEISRQVGELQNRVMRATTAAVAFRRQSLAALVRSGALREPSRLVREKCQALDALVNALGLIPLRIVDNRRDQLARAGSLLQANRPSKAVAAHSSRIASANQLLRVRMQNQMETAKRHSIQMRNMLEALNANATLRRGFTITTDATGKPVRSASDLVSGQPIETQFSSGRVVSIVQDSE